MDMEKYNEIMDKLRECVRMYDLRYSQNKYTYGLANGEYLNITIPKSRIAHLLGVDVDLLRNENFVKSDTPSYEILKEFLEYDYYSLSKKISKDKLFSVFSKNIMEKLEAFIYNINLKLDDMYCMVKYSSEKTYQSDESFEIFDYYIVRLSNHKYYILGLSETTKLGSNRTTYVPGTSRMYTDYYEFEKYFEKIAKNQDITYPTLFKVENFEKEYTSPNYFLKINDKKIILDRVNNMAYKYHATSSVGRDFYAVLNSLSNNYQKKDNENALLKMLKESIKNGNVLSREEIDEIVGEDFQISEDFRQLIDLCNDSISFSTSDTESYSVIENENRDLKEELTSLKNELIQLKEEISNLKNTNEEITLENNCNKQKLELLNQTFEKVKNM